MALGIFFGVVVYRGLKSLPVHQSMLDVSELIYDRCKTYLIAQGKFLVLLELLVGVIIILFLGAF